MNKLIKRRIFELCSVCKRNYQVTVVGGASDIGQTLSLLLQSEPAINKLVVHDNRRHTLGVVMDLSHIPTGKSIKGYTGEDTLEISLKDADIVIAAGGLVWKPGITKMLWMSVNTEFVITLTKQIAKMDYMPFLGIVTEPINCLIPMAAEVLRHHGAYDSRKLFGITGVDALRAKAMFSAQTGFNSKNCYVPVIGGHSKNTVIPLLSQSKPASNIDAKTCQDFTEKLRDFDDQIIKATQGFAPTLSVAHSTLLFTRSLINAMNGQPTKVHAFIENNDFGTDYFGGLVHLNSQGVKDMERYTSLTPFELQLLERSLEELRRDVSKGKKSFRMLD